MVDIGCGIGTWPAAFKELGVDDVLGIDGDYVDRASLLIPEANFRARDLERPLRLDRTFDLALSVEVAEHLTASAAPTFVESLTALAEVVVFSAAIPRQGGTSHLNEQWPDYWRHLFDQVGYDMIDCLRRPFWDDEAIAGSYRQNMFVYLKRTVLEKYPDVIASRHDLPLRMVHPVVFEYQVTRPYQPTLRPILRALPGAIAGAIRARGHWLRGRVTR